MSDDGSHSYEFVQHCFENLFYFLQDHAISMDRYIIWSDNCIGQFKNAHMFYWLCRMHLERGCLIFEVFLIPAMGKGNMMEQGHL